MIFHCTADGHLPDFVAADDRYQAAEAFARQAFDPQKPFRSIDVQVQGAADESATVIRVLAGTNFLSGGSYDCFAAISEAKADPAKPATVTPAE